MGFNEVQFDYIRFPENAARVDREAFYPGQGDQPKAAAMRGFMDRANEQLAEYNVFVSADTFGVIASSWGDSDQIGQIWEDFALRADYQKPMIYPSHYGRGYFGFAVPDANPGGTITRALTDAIKRNAPLEDPALIRPWLQSFTATWIRGHIPYGAAEVREQIDAALALGIEEYILWSSMNRYPRDAFLTEEEANRRADKLRREREEKGFDVLGRTARQAGEIYLQSFKDQNWREAYSLQRNAPEGNDYRSWFNGAAGRVKEWQITGTQNDGSTVTMELDVTVSLRGEDKIMRDETWPLIQENNIWRIKPSSIFLELIEGREDSGAEPED